MVYIALQQNLADCEMSPPSSVLPGLLSLTAGGVAAAEALITVARDKVRALVAEGNRISGEKVNAHQIAVHGLAWAATYGAALREMHHWAEKLDGEGRFGVLEQLILQAAFGEYLWQLYGGIPMNQGELVRPQDMGLAPDDQRSLMTPAVQTLTQGGNTAQVRAEIAGLISASGAFGEAGDDEETRLVREQFRRFTEDKVTPFAHDWHLKDELIPLELITEMGEMGVFGLTIPEEYGGFGMGKIAMCVVSEELCRGYIGVGSLATRSEIAAELILTGGTETQKRHWLPRIASAEILPTAVFTEPGTGSDLGSLKTRAVKDGDHYMITGNKTWITHAARTDLMTLLARTNAQEKGYKGLSMFLAEKPRGTVAAPFPADGMSGSEIEVLGYRGMKEYEIGFDGFEVAADNLLGQVEGEGFKQLMRTFESARIQTAARAVGVAQNALEIGLSYARERKQFGREIFAFPRVNSKIAWAAVETMIARQLTLFSAREKDEGRRCDLEAGMAKLLAARVAWANADNALQIHGGNGFALEYPISRILCDARILNIFEGAAEIQAQVIGRRILE